jgi:NAD(P)-dependent dehydrogenase (short-subunit alcohol dehydrogenase family)
LKGLRVAVTGANSGIGFATAQKLAKLGAKVYMLCRDQGRGEAAKALIEGDVSLLLVDMSSYESIKALEMPEVDVLVHNAGAMFDKREQVVWPGGPLDQTFALHVAGPFLLSRQVKSKQTIWVSSGGMYSQKLNVDHTLNPPDNPFDGMVAYARCKRAQVVLARRLGHHSMHPGWVDTPGLSVAMPKFYERTKTILRTLD